MITCSVRVRYDFLLAVSADLILQHLKQTNKHPTAINATHFNATNGDMIVCDNREYMYLY